MSRPSAAAAQQRAGYPARQRGSRTIYRQLGGQSHTESI